MSDGSTPETLIGKAERAGRSARVLLEDGDVDGACNRAHYAEFDAARGALASLSPPVGPETVRTHRGVIARFNDRLVRTELVSRDLGRLLKRTEELRLLGDYQPGSVEHEDAVEAVEGAERFVSAMRATSGI